MKFENDGHYRIVPGVAPSTSLTTWDSSVVAEGVENSEICEALATRGA